LFYLCTGKDLVDSFRDNLRGSYKAIREVSEEDEWPPNQPEAIINVVVIHHTGRKGQKELMKVVHRHKIGSPIVDRMALSEDPFKKMTLPKMQHYNGQDSSDNSIITKDISDIFSADSTVGTGIPPRTILIEGAPGIGKTVLAEEAAYKWANGELFKNKKFFLLFYMRDEYIQSVESLSDLLNKYANQDKQMVSQINEHINRNGGEDVVFLLDGFDECPKKITFLYDLIRGKNLPKATVIVTSRPTALTSLFVKKVEILGFAEEQRNQYIEMSLSSKKSKIILLDYLYKNPIINSICYIPLCLAILMYLFKEGSLPKTLTEMNKLFIIHTVCHHIGKKGGTISGGFSDIGDLPEGVLAIIHKLSKLAYVGLRKNKLVFTKAEVKNICPEIVSNKEASNGYGLLSSVKHRPQSGAAGHAISFNFLHLTIQEYLAAYFVSNLPPDQQPVEIKEFWTDHLSFMWMMFIGISGVQSAAFQQFLSKQQDLAVGGTVLGRKKGLHLFQCILEASGSDVTLPDIISGLFTDDHINLQGLTLLPYHVLSLTTFMAKSPSKWKSINLENCHIGDRGMSILKRYLCNKRYKLKTSAIEQLNVFGNDLTSIHDAYCKIIERGHFQRFKISNHNLSDQFVKKIANAVTKNNTIRALDISSNRFGVDGLAAIVVCLKTSMILESLNISNNNIGYRGADLIASALCSRTVLKELNLSRSDLHDDGAVVIVKSLGHANLKILDLSWNSISGKGASEIAHSLGVKKDTNTPTEGAAGSHQESENDSQASTTLEELNLSHNKLGNAGAECLSSMLKVNSSLKLLDISSNGLTDEGVAFMCDSLLLNATLQHLFMSGNNVTSTSRIAGVLEINCYLLTLNLQQYSTKAFSFYSTILSALRKNNILSYLGLPKCTEQSQLDEAIAEINKSRSHQKIRAIAVEYYK